MGKGPIGLRVHLDDGSGFDLTEQGTQKRLAVYVVRDPALVPGVARLGIDPLDPVWQTAPTGAEAVALDALVQSLITQRADARAGKDWAAADRIRDALAASGIAVADGKDDTTWSIA